MPSLKDLKNLLEAFNQNKGEGILTIVIIFTSFSIFLILEIFIGLLLAGLISFIPSLGALIYIAKKQNKKQEKEKEKQRQEKLKLLKKLVNENENTRSLDYNSEWEIL